MKTYVVIVLDRRIYAIDIEDEQNHVKELRFNKTFANHLFVTFQPSELVNILGLDAGCLVNILDFECLDKEIRQSIIYVDTHKWNWQVSDMVRFYLEKEFEWDENQIFQGLILLKECFLEMKARGASEWNRIESIEIPINRVLYKCQKVGIYVDNAAIKQECENCYTVMYHLKNRIQLELGQTSPDYQLYLQDIDTPNWIINRYKLKILTRKHPELHLFRDLEKNEKNYLSLLFMASLIPGRRCKPLYKGFGSSTGRIIIKEPALQNLNRHFRNFIKDPMLESSGKKYLYVDYSQFEAGILAGLTENEKLKKLYLDGKIYEKLCSFLKINDRELAKAYFYCFIYGGIVLDGTERFFEEYCSKEKLDKIIEKAQREGKISTALGNNRVLESGTDNKWIINHLIQGTSSLIFKEALLNVDSINHGNIQLVMPMHDAALYIVNKDVSEELIMKLFSDAFMKYIPKLKPIIKVKDFFKGE